MLRQEAQSECVPVSHTNAGSGLEAPFYHSSVFEQSYRPNTAQTLYVWSEFGGNTTRHSQESLPGVHELRAVAHTQARLGRLARTRTLLFILMLAGALLMAYTAIVSVRSRTYSIYIPRAACTVDSGWEIWLPYGIAITCIGPVFLALEVAMWMTNDVYNTRADIFACMVSSQIALIVYVLWVTVLSNVKTHLSEMFIVWLAMLVAHIFSICWPLWCSIRQRSHLEAQPLRSGFGHPYRETRLRRSLYSPLYKEFEEMLDNSVQRENFLQFATQYYRSGLPLFLSDFQLLKYQVIEALKDSRHSTCTDNSHLAPHPVANQHAVQLVKDDRYPHESHPLAHLVPITKGIFESAMLLLPPNSIDKTTQFPEAVKSAFSNFVCTYFGRESYMAVSIPNEVVARIQKAVELSNVPLSVLDCAKDEVLFLLCTDVFAGYRKRLEAQCCSTVS
ncbi:hypothetical protein GGH19_000660 [Coemansia sp. RSA 1807]|nr:hypothetical protein GGH19_000660 [Coemansia sp. RSA 1807]